MDAVIEYGDVGKFILAFLKDYDVIAPIEKDNRYIFEQVDDPSKVVYNYDTTILPPVKWIYPNNEVLLRFKLSDLTEAKPVNAFRNQVLLFVHPCDSNAIIKAGYSDKTVLTKTNWERDSAFKKKIYGDINRLSHVLKDEYDDAIWEAEGKKCLS